MINYTNAAYNEKTGILVKFNSERFVIIGDARKVSNKTLNAIVSGNLPKGWINSPESIM